MDGTASDQCPDIQDRNVKTVQHQVNGCKSYRRDKGRSKGELGTAQSQPYSSSPSSSSSSSTICTHNSQRGLRVTSKRRNPRFWVRRRASDVEAIAFPLGMSIAAVVAQVLERTDATWKGMPVEHLSMICTSAVRESLANVFGDKFEPFARNFEKAFQSTLKTLRLVKGSSSMENPQDHRSDVRYKDNTSEILSPAVRKCSSSNYAGNDCEKESRRSDAECPTESIFPTVMPWEVSSSAAKEIQENKPTITRELSLHGSMHRELSCVSSNTRPYSISNSMISAFQKSVVEQVRANDLKETELALNSHSNFLQRCKLHLKETELDLQRCKLSMGVSKASFQAEKFKTQMEDTRHAELIRNCIDCLVGGLLIMSSLIIYGAYVHSYKRIMEATSSCNSSTDSKPWWAIPKPMASFSSGLQTLRCQAQVISRMLFGLLIILAIGYSIFQRAAAPRQTMPVTFILLLLGVGCGVIGKCCIDTLGGSGFHWIFYWEALCALHFFVHMFTPFFFAILYGPIKGTKHGHVLPYWMRRLLFYLVALLLLPLLSGLIPFASLREWKDHLSSFWFGQD